MTTEDLVPQRTFEVALGQLSRAELLSAAVGYAVSADYLRKELDRLRGVELPPDFTTIDEAISRMVLETAARVRAESAELIRGELVCCDIFHRMEALTPEWDEDPESRDWSAWQELKASHDYHDLCFFGEWSAVIVEKGPRE